MRTALLAAAAAFCVSPAFAADEEFDFYRELPGNWNVVGLDEACSFSREFEGPGSTRLSIHYNVDGQVFIIVTNANWSIKKNEIVPAIDIWFDNEPLREPAAGIEANGQRGWVVKSDDSVLHLIAGSDGVKFFTGETLIDSLKLDGTGQAVAALKTCVVRLKAHNAVVQREKDRLAHIPVDPFAKPVEGPIKVPEIGK